MERSAAGTVPYEPPDEPSPSPFPRIFFGAFLGGFLGVVFCSVVFYAISKMRLSYPVPTSVDVLACFDLELARDPDGGPLDAIGSVRIASARLEPPDGWIECHGQTISRAEYPAMFEGRLGVDELRLPDLRGLRLDRRWYPALGEVEDLSLSFYAFQFEPFVRDGSMPSFRVTGWLRVSP